LAILGQREAVVSVSY